LEWREIGCFLIECIAAYFAFPYFYNFAGEGKDVILWNRVCFLLSSKPVHECFDETNI
jgi:hypothetical protein